MDIRFIRPEEEKICNDFHNRIYGEARTIEQWRWTFVPGLYDADEIPFTVVDDNGRIAGTQAFIPVKTIDKGGVFWTVKSEETLVDPDYRGQKLFEKMYDPLKDYLKRNGLHCIWGFTPATKAFKRCGFQAPAVISQLFFPFSSNAAGRAIEGQLTFAKKGKSGGIRKVGYKVGCFFAKHYSLWKYFWVSGKVEMAGNVAKICLKTLDQPPDNTGELMKRFINQWGGQTIYRDSDYLKWRLFNNPYARSIFRAAYVGESLFGWIVYTIDSNSMGYIVDLIAVGNDEVGAEEIIRLLIKDSIENLRAMGAIGIRGWRVNNHPFDVLLTRAARALGFYRVKRGYTAILLVNEESDRRDSLWNIDNWYISRIFTEGSVG